MLVLYYNLYLLLFIYFIWRLDLFQGLFHSKSNIVNVIEKNPVPLHDEQKKTDW